MRKLCCEVLPKKCDKFMGLLFSFQTFIPKQNFHSVVEVFSFFQELLMTRRVRVAGSLLPCLRHPCGVAAIR